VDKFNKGDLVRVYFGVDKGLVVDDFPHNISSVRVFWLTGNFEGMKTWEAPAFLQKLEDRGG